MPVRPVFIFSAPRAGSTLLQRVLASHSAVATTSEPWVLLPLLAPVTERLPASGTRDELIRTAVSDLVAELPGAIGDYRAAVRDFALGLYTKLSPPAATHFVDKTPLYHLIVDEIVETFPEGRFIFLFRNPLAVLASAIELFDGGRFEVARYHMALFQSLADLVPASERHRDRSVAVRYEDLVTGEEAVWRALTDYLDLPWEPAMLSRFGGVELRGRLGDPRGTREYSALSTAPLEKWRESIRNPVRRAWCARYLAWLGPERLATMGYSLDELQAELAETGRGGENLLDDTTRLGASFVREVVKRRLPRNESPASTWRALLRVPSVRKD